MRRSAGYPQSYCSTSLAIAAAESGHRVNYGTLAGLIESLMEVKPTGNLSRRLRVLTHPALLVVDEIGYLRVSQNQASWVLDSGQESTRRVASVHDRYQVQEAALDGDMGDVHGLDLDLIGPVDGEPVEKAGVHPVLGMGFGGPRCLVDGL